MANSDTGNLDSGTNLVPQMTTQRNMGSNGRNHIAGVFLWKRDIRRRIAKKAERVKKNEDSCQEKTMTHKTENVSTSKIMFGFLGNLRKHFRIEKLSMRKSKQKLCSVEQSHTKNANTLSMANKERLDLHQPDDPSIDDSNNTTCISAIASSNTVNVSNIECLYKTYQRTDSHLNHEEKFVNGVTDTLVSDSTTKDLRGGHTTEVINDHIKLDKANIQLSIGHDSSANEKENDVGNRNLSDETNYETSSETRAKANLTEELLNLSKYGWYWGPISGDEADAKLISEPDGAFLVRDSSDDRYLLTLSFKSSGKLLHARMEHSGGLFSLCNHGESEGFTSVAALINHSMNFSQSAVFCYSRPKYPGYPSFPVRLTKPVSRFTRVRSLQYLCRFVIRQNTRLDNIRKLPLPKTIKGYIEEAHF